MHRASTMAFAAGMVVFPGGAWQEGDADLWDTAVRETWEETGVRLDRSALRPWSRWVTPGGSPIRYDTRFFVAVCDADVGPSITGAEAVFADWSRPADALASVDGRGLVDDAAHQGDAAAARDVHLGVRRAGRGADADAPAVRAGAPGGAGVTAQAYVGGQATPRARCVLAPNPGPMTLDGTNTWVLAEPGSSLAVVVDPGPADENHLAAVQASVEAEGRRVALVLLTHTHADHAAGARSFADRTGAPVRALDQRHRGVDEALAAGDVVEVGGLVVEALATPGHSADSLCFVLRADEAVLTGDTVLGRGTSVVAHPDGRLADYLASLHRLRDLASASGITTVLPGHGPVLGDALNVVEGYLAHRAERLAQVEAALAAGDRTAAEVVRRVYADVDPVLWPAAEMSVRAQLDYLRAR